MSDYEILILNGKRVTDDNPPEKILSDAVMDLADLCAGAPKESKQIDPRAWSILRIYMPQVDIHEMEYQAAVDLFEKTACKQTYDMKGGVEAVVRFVAGQVPDSWTAAETYRIAIAKVCEGWNLPDGARKVLEDALWNNTPQHVHRVAVIRNEAVKSGAMCLDCGMLMSEADTLPESQTELSYERLKELGGKEGDNSLVNLVARYATTYRDAYERLVESLEAKEAQDTNKEQV